MTIENIGNTQADNCEWQIIFPETLKLQAFMLLVTSEW
jgi:hypothetical protein